MLEFRRTEVAVIGCFARPAALDELAVNRLAIRVEANELMVLGSPDDLAALEQVASQHLRSTDPTGIAIDLTGAYSVWTLSGSDRFEGFRRLCAIRPPSSPAPLLGLFADLPARMLLTEDLIHVFVSSAAGYYVRERILETCSDLGALELDPVGLSVAEEQAA